jgi:hypothetical protein
MLALMVNAQSPTRQGVATPSSNSPRRRRGCCRHMQSPAACSGCCSAGDEGSQYRLCWLTVWVTFSEQNAPPIRNRAPHCHSGCRLTLLPVLGFAAWAIQWLPLYRTYSTTHGNQPNRLAIDVIEYPADKRDEVMQRMGILFTDVARDAGCTRGGAGVWRCDGAGRA